jgi:hypothetical protein
MKSNALRQAQGAALKHGNPRARGGKRAGAGRKPQAATVLKRKLADRRTTEAGYAFTLLCKYMRSAPPRGKPETMAASEFRAACAQRVLDQVLGKPMQRVEQSGAVKLLVVPNDGDA